MINYIIIVKGPTESSSKISTNRYLEINYGRNILLLAFADDIVILCENHIWKIAKFPI